MAISEDNKRLYVDTTDPNNPIGISLWEIMKCLGYYKRDTNGNRNLGMIIKNADIDKWAKRKPFAYDATSFDSDEARDVARKNTPYTTGISQALKIPIVRNLVTLSDNNDRWTYLVAAAGSHMMNQGNPAEPDYQYVRPQGIESNEPFRYLDFDGYDHSNPLMPIWKAGAQYFTAGGTHEVNRFSTPKLRFYIMANPKGGSHLTLEDIVQNPDNMRFVVEECDNTDISDGGTPYYQWTRPSKVHVSSGLAADVEQTGQFIDVELDAANDGKKISFVFGINQIDSTTMLPYAANGVGMFAPWDGGLHWIEFTQKMEFDLLLQPLRFATGGSTLNFITLPNYTYTTTTSSDIIVEMQVQKGNGYYITGANFTGTLPSGAINYQFKFMNTSSGAPFNSNIVGMVSNELGQTSSSLYVYVEPKSSLDPDVVEYQTIYLRFNNVMTSAGNYTTGRLMGSPDGGSTWGEITSGNAGLTLYITKR